MVLMKNTANAFAPAGVCRVAATGITGGRSPGLVFAPVLGTSAGTVACPTRPGETTETARVTETTGPAR
jgi:hypothetical protein